MTKTLEFIFDFASPNAYLAYRALPPILERAKARLEIIPCLLGGIFKLTGNQAPWMTFAHVESKLAYDMLEMRRFIESHKLERFKMTPHFPPNTLTLMRGLLVADLEGEKVRYIEAALTAMWEEGENMSDEKVIIDALNRAGLDGKSILVCAKDQAIKDKLAINTKNAVDRGVFGVPTFFIGSEMFFGKERLDQIETELLRRRKNFECAILRNI